MCIALLGIYCLVALDCVIVQEWLVQSCCSEELSLLLGMHRKPSTLNLRSQVLVN